MVHPDRPMNAPMTGPGVTRRPTPNPYTLAELYARRDDTQVIEAPTTGTAPGLYL